MTKDQELDRILQPHLGEKDKFWVVCRSGVS